MAHTSEKILSLLPLLDEQIADDLETETLDFKGKTAGAGLTFGHLKVL